MFHRSSKLSRQEQIGFETNFEVSRASAIDPQISSKPTGNDIFGHSDFNLIFDKPTADAVTKSSFSAPKDISTQSLQATQPVFPKHPAALAPAGSGDKYDIFRQIEEPSPAVRSEHSQQAVPISAFQDSFDPFEGSFIGPTSSLQAHATTAKFETSFDIAPKADASPAVSFGAVFNDNSVFL